MKAKKNSQVVWVIYFVGFDDSMDDAESIVQPYVGKERIESSGTPEQIWEEANLAVLARGGQLLAFVTEDESQAEAMRQANEAEILRRR
jgi:hypothetical protein